MTLARTALVALAIVFVPQGLWSALIALNLRTTPSLPWAVIVVVLALWFVAHYVNGSRRPSLPSAARHQPPRASLVSRPILLWAWLAGGFALVALVGYWITFASFVRMPGSVLPDFSGVPWWTVSLAIATGAAISPVCEQAGLWGYWQVALENTFSGRTAIIVTAIVFAALPHPPMHAALWPKLVFFFLTGLTFSTMAYLTDSILPGLSVHAVSLLTFFVLVWPQDAQRPLVGDVGMHRWVWLHIAQAAGFSLLACWAFRRLREVAARAA